MKVNRNFERFFYHQKTVKKKTSSACQALWASSLSIIFAEPSLKPVYPTIVVKKFKFTKNYNFWKMYLVKIHTLDMFTYMLPPALIRPIAYALTTLFQVLWSPLRQGWSGILGYLYFIWFVNFSNVMNLQFCK